ncbi:MAG: hypothetical protein J5I90_21690 [Caldilineales bacterium]|nr:hypothetical protein [Caldilineales bacterium]
MPMSINGKNKTVAEILNRASTDAAFRNLLYTDPGAALAGYNLSDADRAALSDPETVKAALNG